MLDLMVFDDSSNARTGSTSENLALQNTFSKIYPNPNNGEMQMDYELRENENGELVIYDMTGRELSNYKLLQGKNTLQISEQSIPNGIYLYRITVNDTVINTDKLVIIK
jgi:hypothetical protein